MRLNEIEFPDVDPVDGYGPGFFRIGGVVWRGAILSGPAGVAKWKGVDDVAQILDLRDKVDVVFVGTGAEVEHLPKSFVETLEEAGFGVEAMSSPAACRTYNVLLAEGRRVALAALPV